MDRALIDYLTVVYATEGSRAYGEESVSQLEHALQCALLAEEEGASDALVAASLLHDVGHLLFEASTGSGGRGIDDRHEYRPIRMLRRAFGEAVLGPIRLHVAAKRYLCAVDPNYGRALSPASRRSLELQGGPFACEAAKRFIRQPHAANAVRLRTWDDRAKLPGRTTLPFGHYLEALLRCAHEPADTKSPT